MKNIKVYDGSNFEEVSKLLADMMKKYTFKNVNEKSKDKFLGVFKYVGSNESNMIIEIERALAISDIWLAYENDKIIGIIRGKRDNIYNLFVKEKFTNKGLGKKLVSIFENKCISEGFSSVRLSSTVDSVEFYENIGYKKTTGMRISRYTGKNGYEYQPMIKILCSI